MDEAQYVIPGLEHFFQVPISDSADEKLDSNTKAKHDSMNQNLKSDPDEGNTLDFHPLSE
jgi:hypothetical protein